MEHSMSLQGAAPALSGSALPTDGKSGKKSPHPISALALLVQLGSLSWLMHVIPCDNLHSNNKPHTTN